MEKTERETHNSVEKPPAIVVGSRSFADVAVLIVSYNSASHLSSLLSSLPSAAPGLRLRIVVADNSSTDRSVEVAHSYAGVVVVPTGGNLGYAGGINVAMTEAGDCTHVLVLNPDVRLEPSCVTTLVATMTRTGAGVVVPRIIDCAGSVYPSLRREPTVLTALGDAVLGSRGRSRPGFLSETVWQPDAYVMAHPIDWATGAALLVHRDLVASIGDWDEQFFLYSEETDLMRRVRDQGSTVWFEPRATAHHARGGSGASDQLNVLMTVNRVRYARKHFSARAARAFRVAVLLGEVARFRGSAHRSAIRMLLDEKAWGTLPHAQRIEVAEPVRGAVVVPAHNEGSVIRRTLKALAPLTERGVEVLVAANGCTDNTVDEARSIPNVKVLDLPTPSKTAALNAADEAATSWPRIYLDADVEIEAVAVVDVFRALGEGTPACRPAFRWETSGASFLVRRYYRARGRMPSMTTSLWGAGAYALSEEGHQRFGRFPDVTADDVFVDQTFRADEKMIVDTVPVVVHTPLNTHDLMSVLRRQVRGPAELQVATRSSTMRELARTVGGPVSMADAGVYATMAVASRWLTPAVVTAWERDASSRALA